MMRLLITGGPKTGKTTSAADIGAERGLPVRHTDDTKDLPWSEASAEVATWIGAPGPWLIEGVAVPRALRKWLKANPTGAPCEEIIVLTKPHAQLSRGQASMAKGLHTVLAGIEDQLLRRGVKVTYR